MSRERRPRSLEKRRSAWGWYYIAPGILFFSIFSFYPIVNAFWTSFTNKKLLSLKAPRFVGLQNYERILGSPDFWNSIRATLAFAAGAFVPLFVLSLLFAVLIAGRRKGQRLA